MRVLSKETGGRTSKEARNSYFEYVCSIYTIYIVGVGRIASICLHGLQGTPLLLIYDMYEVEAFLPLKSLQVKHILYILRGGGYNMIVFSG